MVAPPHSTSNPSTVDSIQRRAEIRRCLDLLFRPGDVFEIRALDVPSGRYRNTVSGYFNNLDAAAAAAECCDCRGAVGVYVTINPCNPALLARRSNRLEERAKETTKDEHIICRHWLPIDVDSDRISGISATEEEKQAARDMAAAIEDVLRSHGFPFPLLVDSGNGCYLLFAIDLPNDSESTSLMKAFLESLARAVPSQGAHIDQAVYNASRIMRIGGTSNRKGDNTLDRPHRPCHYGEPIPECPVDIVPVERIRAFVEKFSAPAQTKPASHGGSGNGPHQPRLDVGRYLADRGVSFRVKRETGATAYIVPCPFGDHGSNGETAVHQADNGLLTFECKHNSCQGRRWADYRDAIGKPDASHYDPPLNGSGNQAAKAADESSAAVKYLAVKPGTKVKATDKGENYGTVVADNDQSCAVHFVSPEGQEATKEIDKRYLFLLDGTPLATGGSGQQWTKAPSIGELVLRHPKLRRPIIHKLLRIGETCNIIAPPKRGKSWLAIMLGISNVLGRKFLDTYDTEPGKVLILDNELHGETSADRVPRVAAAMGVDFAEIADRLFVENFRGRLADIFTLDEYLTQYESGEWSLIVCDSLYRFLPEGTDENNNSQMTHVYNQIDYYAMKLGCGFACVHHASKGNQSGKSVTDVGAGAGSQARAVDTHLILRDHAEPDCVVLEAAARSWPPVEPIVLRWAWPVWTLTTDLDPTALKQESAKQQQNRETKIRNVCQQILDTFDHFPDGATKTKIRDRVGQSRTFDEAWRLVCNSGQLIECKVLAENRQEYDGFKRIYDKGQEHPPSPVTPVTLF